MPESARDYFQYFITTPEGATWGLDVTAAGFSSVGAGVAYPVAQHPADHHFDWAHGRTLAALQILFVGRGRGWFESKTAGAHDVAAGDAFCLLPGEWHRYRPDPAVGWDESWIEVQGPLVEKLITSGVLAAGDPVRRGVVAVELDAALQAVHERARRGGKGFDPARAAAAYAVLAAWDQAARTRPPRTQLARAVLEAERYLGEHHHEAVNIEALARRLGVAYSHFRRAFRDHTGFAPWQYVLHLRLTRARRLLAAGDATLDDIAAQLGFSSAFHLSAAFKRSFGVSPQRWREDLRGGISASRRRRGVLDSGTRPR
ncbi:MAG: helix-turn-helix transcriptional regulator [Opitutaceae bacterium]|nr:helix-turn-helix transcriptional regulator [Opitutaceae bacterium]